MLNMNSNKIKQFVLNICILVSAIEIARTLNNLKKIMIKNKKIEKIN